MGRKIDPAQARIEAKNYLDLALALLDQAGAFKAALHTATALEYIDIGNCNLDGDAVTGHVPIAAQLSDRHEMHEFSISWGVLVSADSADRGALLADVPHHES
jgi:hypothetical protein